MRIRVRLCFVETLMLNKRIQGKGQDFFEITFSYRMVLLI
ncbi:hypothetical protein Godav_017765 [Gossypium davidsonii]|uniref:Uncharacterized protein n=1 Tax=Gossypium davidsonii TaxID=34287 RepID=A0A7J8QUB1_GOSDV|nr:hypothetical protein [Gossypium davidsonii]